MEPKKIDNIFYYFVSDLKLDLDHPTRFNRFYDGVDVGVSVGVDRRHSLTSLNLKPDQPKTVANRHNNISTIVWHKTHSLSLSLSLSLTPFPFSHSLSPFSLSLSLHIFSPLTTPTHPLYSLILLSLHRQSVSLPLSLFDKLPLSPHSLHTVSLTHHTDAHTHTHTHTLYLSPFISSHTLSLLPQTVISLFHSLSLTLKHFQKKCRKIPLFLSPLWMRKVRCAVIIWCYLHSTFSSGDIWESSFKHQLYLLFCRPLSLSLTLTHTTFVKNDLLMSVL
jgi:hypothetical protein